MAAEVLKRLIRYVKRERTFYRRIYKASTGAAAERAFGELNVCTMFLRELEKELQAVDKPAARRRKTS